VVDAVDHGDVGAFAGRGNKDPLRAGVEEHRRLVPGGEEAGAFQRDVDAERLVWQFGGVPDRRHLDRTGADVDRVAGDLHLVRKAAVDRVIP